MRRDRREIERQRACERRVRVGVERGPVVPVPLDVVADVRQPRLAVPLGPAREEIGPGEQPVPQHGVEREEPRQRAPLGRHVRDRHPVLDAEPRHAVARELDAPVEHLVVVEVAAQRDDDVLARRPVGQLALEDDAHLLGHLPPCLAHSPDRRGVGAHHRRPARRDRAVDIRVRVAPHAHRPRRNVPLLDHHLVGDAPTRGVIVHPVLGRERADLGVLAQVLGSRVLDIVIDREHRLLGPSHPPVPARDRVELPDHRARVVVGHQVLGADGHEIAGVDGSAAQAPGRVGVHDLLYGGLRHAGMIPSACRLTTSVPVTRIRARRSRSGPGPRGEQQPLGEQQDPRREHEKPPDLPRLVRRPARRLARPLGQPGGGRT